MYDNYYMFPISFTTTNYIFGPLPWIDQICGSTLTKTISDITISGVVRNNWSVDGYYIMGY